MTTVGLELTSFVDPSLTWKTVSKGRNTSRRSRRSVSKNMKMGQEQEKRSPKRLTGLQCSDSEQANVRIHGPRFAANMEHIPIKKRRLFFRSPSPPLQSPNREEESEGLVGDQCTSNQRTCSSATTESQVMQINFSNGSISKDSNSDGNIDKNRVKPSNVMHGPGEDFSGIAILAAAACSDRLDHSIDDAGKSQSQSQGGGILDIDREQNESFASASDMKKGITSIESSDLLGKDTELVEGVGVVDVLKDSAHVVCVNNDADDAGMSPIKEFKQTESDASPSAIKENVECLGLPDSLGSDAVYFSKDSAADLPNEVDKTSENSGATRDFRLHWDLNTVMDEWGNPLDDTSFDSITPLGEGAPVNIEESQNLEDVKGSEAQSCEIQNPVDIEGSEAKRSKAAEDGVVTSQAKVCTGPDSVLLQDDAGFTSVSPAFSRMGYCSEVSSGFVTSILKNDSSPSNAKNYVVGSVVCSTDSEIQPEVVNEDAHIDHSLSLGLNATKTVASEETNNVAGFENPNEVPERASCFVKQNVHSEDREIGFLLAPLSVKAFSEVKGADCQNIEDLKVKNDLDENNNKVADATCPPPTTTPLGSSKCEIAALDALEPAVISCEVNNLKAVSVSTKVVGVVTTSMNMHNDQATGKVVAQEIEQNPTVTDVSESDPLNDHDSKALVPKILDHCISADARSEQTNSHLAEKSLGGDNGSHLSNEDSSQVTENAGAVIEFEGGYDSHLEDGELRESHCWEDNEGEDGDTEHVDYDSDNRDGFVFYEAANDSVQLSGEVLVGEYEKQSCRSDNFSSADDQPNPDKSVEENCSLQVQGCLSPVDAVEAVCTIRETSTLKACSGANNSDKIEMDHKDCRSSIEAESIEKDFDNDPARKASGASASGRDLQFSDRRCSASMRRSRSSNFDCMHHTDVPDETSTRSQQPSMRMGRFGGRAWNPEMKTNAANVVSEDDAERILRAPGETSPLRGRRPRIINTSRSGYHFVRRGSPVERDSDYGMGMMKTRDMSPDNNPRSRFGRFNGINRGFREGYRRPGFYEGPKSGGGGPMMNRFSKRDRSFSPVGDRFHRKSRSRSRTRSPDFRSEARMGRVRPPYQQANHVADHTRERRSPVRVFNQNQRLDALGSPGRLRSDDCMRPTMRPIRPMRFHDTTTTSGRGHDFEENDEYRRKPLLMRNQRRSRSRSRSCSPDFRSDARIGSMRVPYQQPSTDHLRDRRSPPVRVFRADQRYEGGGSPVRLRSDECLRPMMRPLRFPDTAQPGRGHEYNNNNNGDEYRRKPRNIFERIHPVRQYDVEGDARRFQYDDEDAVPPTQNFRRNENFSRAGERRPVEFRGPREERGNIRYNNNNNNNSERMFYSGPKQFGGVRDYSEDGVPRRVRP